MIQKPMYVPSIYWRKIKSYWQYKAYKFNGSFVSGTMVK